MNLDIEKERMEFLNFAPAPLPGYWCERQEREFAVWCAAKARATPSPAPIRQTKQDSCIPPFAEPASQLFEMVLQLSDALSTANLLLASTFISNGLPITDRASKVSEQVEQALVDAGKVMLAGRCRAQGGIANPCKACNGEGVIHTGIDEAPASNCRKCDGSGLAPTVKASQ